MLEPIKDAIETDGLGLNNIFPLLGGERLFSRLVEEVLIHGFPGAAGPVPGTEGLIDLEENRVPILDNATSEPRSTPRNEIFFDKLAEKLSFACVTSFLLFKSLIGVSSMSDTRDSGEPILSNRGTSCSVDGVLLHIRVSRLCINIG